LDDFKLAMFVCSVGLEMMAEGWQNSNPLGPSEPGYCRLISPS
jgi:hypothetical protein